MGSFPKTYNDPDIDTRGKFDSDTPAHWIPGTGFQILCQWNMDYGLWITDSDRSWDCLSCIPDSKVHDSTILQQIFAGFRNPNSITWGEYLVINQNQLTNLNILCSSL